MYLCDMNATGTREKILQQMFCDIRRNGFQGLRADRVVAEMGITKGALYHYFPNKQAIGTAVLDEIIRPGYLEVYRRLDYYTGDPIAFLRQHIDELGKKATDEEVSLGCPLNNLVQEMSPLDEDFRLRMKAIVEQIENSVASALERGKAGGFVRMEVNAEAVGKFFFAALEGAFSMAKVIKSAEAFRENVRTLGLFLETCRPAPDL